MKLKIKYFGVLAEITGFTEEFLEFSGGTVAELLTTLYEGYPNLKDKEFQVAQDFKIVALDSKLTANEIALLPPFSGG